MGPDVDGGFKPGGIVEAAHFDGDDVGHVADVQQHGRAAMAAEIDFQLAAAVAGIFIALQLSRDRQPGARHQGDG